jgi:SAM-dependent methyltransferase
MASRAKDLLGKMLRSHETIYNDAFWDYLDRVFTGHRARTLAGGNRLSVLEVACGPGLLARKLLGRYPVAELTATDGSPTMLRYARRELADGGGRARDRRDAIEGPEGETSGSLVPRVGVQRLDFNAPTWRLRSGPFDAAFIGLSFRNVADPVRFLRSLRPHLAPTGALIIYDFVRVPWGEFRTAWSQHVDSTGADAADSESTFSRFRNFCVFTIDDVAAIAIEAGYRLTDHQRIDAPMALYVATLVPVEGTPPTADQPPAVEGDQLPIDSHGRGEP